MTNEEKSKIAETNDDALSGNYITLRTEGLVKIFKRRKVVNGVSVSISQGQIVGLLGPNGAGKTTTFRMVVGILTPNKGNVYINDRPIT